MIAKRISMNSVKKSSFVGLINYITSSQSKTERVGQITITNCNSDDANWAAMEVKATQDQNKRAATDKTYHLIVAFSPGENPSPETLKSIEARICAGLGYAEHQRVSAVHHDTDHLHIHIAINKIHPTRLTIHEPYYDKKYKLAAMCEKLEQEYGLVQVNHKAARTEGQGRAGDMEAHAGIQSLIGWIQRECKPQLDAAASWQDFSAILARHDLQIQQRGNGLVIVDVQGTAVKASSIGREFSKPKLEERFGPFAAANQPNREEPAHKQYRDRPVPTRMDTTELFAQFQDNQKSNTHDRAGALQNARARKDKAIEAARKGAKLKRDAMKLTKGRVVKKVLYASINKTLRSDIERIQQSYRAERQVITTKYQRRDWVAWLTDRAGEGSTEALAALQARRTRPAQRGNFVAGTQQAAGPGLAAGSPVDSITKKGTVIYRVGAAAVRDDGARLNIARGATDRDLESLLRLAQQRYGNTLTITGTAAFKDKLAAVAAAANLPVVFKELPTTSIQTGTTTRKENGNDRPIQSSASRKPHVAAVGRKPPPQAKNRLRGLRELGVVHVAGGAEVLLPRDVPRNVDHSRAAANNDVRRDVSGAGGERGPLIAAEKYIKERNDRRKNTFDIPEHKRYTVKETGSMTYAGQRNIDGQALVLLRQKDHILVLPVDDDAAKRLEKIRLGASVSVLESGMVQVKGRKR